MALEFPFSDFYLGIFLALIVALIAGIVTAIQKRSVDETDEFLTSWAFRFFGLPAVLPFVIWFGIPETAWKSMECSNQVL